ncbi:MAG: hypothetical protein K0R54_11 [Clostridiaceae bacterium]|nr:hypothetical protein [Clostridiaceae bacterium]
MGGYTSFNLENEKKEGFLEIIEIEDDKEPLTREQMYPKNSKDFEYGWISPEGDTYNTGHEGHSRSADVICEELWGYSYHGERDLEDKGWLKVTGSWDRGKLKKAVYSKDYYITKKQADTLFDIGLWEIESVKFMIRKSENRW